MVSKVPDQYSFPKEEERILELWKKLDAFQNCLKQSKDRPRYTFYDGPPFATGLPHYGHILAGTIKVIDMLVMLVELSLVGYCNKICSSKWISC